MATLSPVLKQRFFTAAGLPLVGGKLFTYEAGTTTPLATYTDYGGASANANPVILDANGEADVWLGSRSYKFILKDSADVTQWTIDNVNQGADQAITSSSALQNLGITTTVGSSALTVNLTDSLGVAPSSESPVKVGFRSSTISSGLSTVVSVEAATSLVVPSGATLGHSSGVTDYIYVYLINNSGVAELAVSRRYYVEKTTISTVALGSGSDASDVIYSTTARTGVSLRLIGRLTSNQTTAGTWASTISEIQTAQEAIRAEKVYAHFTSNSGTVTSTPAAFAWTSEEWDPYGMNDSTNAFVVPWTGLWDVEFSLQTAILAKAAVFQSLAALNDGSNYIENFNGQPVHPIGTFSYTIGAGRKTVYLKAGVLYFVYVYQNSGADMAYYSGSDYKTTNYLKIFESGK